MREPKPVHDQWLIDMDVNNMYMSGNHIIWGTPRSGKSNWQMYFLKSRPGDWSAEKEHKSPFKS